MSNLHSDNMNESCSCDVAGFCERRQAIMSSTHFKRCQAGQCEMLDRLYAKPKSPTTIGPSRHLGLHPRSVVGLPGTILKQTITRLVSIKTQKGCGCNNLANLMDRRGPDWCEGNRDTIVDHLMGNKDILIDAIKNSEFTGHNVMGWAAGLAVAEPVLKMGAGWLVGQAIEKSRVGYTPPKPKPPRKKNTPVIRRRVRSLTALQINLWKKAMAAPHPQPDPFTDTPVLHLGSHLWPVRENWQWHAEKWNQLAEQINGRCIVGVVTDESTDSVEKVRSVLSSKFELFEGPNTKSGENPTFERLQTMIPSGQNDVLLYCHGKGVRSHTFASPAVRIWTEIMYETAIFAYQRNVQHLANGYKLVGSFRTFGDAPHKPVYRWHYSGTFWTLRAKYLPGRAVRPGYGGVEAWPGYHFAPQDVCCAFADNLAMGQTYDHQYMLSLTPALEEWRRQNET